jgi:hypothetical protein
MYTEDEIKNAAKEELNSYKDQNKKWSKQDYALFGFALAVIERLKQKELINQLKQCTNY